MLKQRLIYGALGVILAIAVITLCPSYIIGICVGVLSLIALGEFYTVTGLWGKKSPATIAGMLFCVVCTSFATLWSAASINLIAYCIIALVFVLMVFMVLFHGKFSFADAAISLLGTVYITVFFLHVLFARQLEFGKILIWVLFIPAWATDTFAYFCGRAFGKHKLCPSVSPKKTVEGAIGGVVGCIVCVMLYVYIISKSCGMQSNLANAAILALAASVFSQFGDLAASCIKREYGVKDYGNLIPGHGGILDRFDSTILIAPLIYYMLSALPILFR